MNHPPSASHDESNESPKIRADLAILAAYIVASESNSLPESSDASDQWQAASQVRYAYAQEDLDYCIALVRRGDLRIEQVIFENEPVTLQIGTNVSHPFTSKMIGMPCWITEENIKKIESIGGPYILAVESRDEGQRSDIIEEIYKSNMLLETWELSEEESLDEMGYFTWAKVFTSMDAPDDYASAFLKYLHCTDYFPLFKDVRVRSMVSLHAAARLGDFSEVPAETMNSYFEWHGQYRDGTISYDEANSNSPFHYAAHAGHFDKIPPSIISAAGLLKIGIVDNEFALKHSELIELEWLESYDYYSDDFGAKYEEAVRLREEWHKKNGYWGRESPDFEQQVGVPMKRELHVAYACPIVLAVVHGQTDRVVEAIQSVPASEWVNANGWAHRSLAGVASKTGIEDRISDLLTEIAQLTPPPSEQAELDPSLPDD